ncbi:ras family-domain-containing protein [Dipodascopsis uninucleata]
MREQYMRAGQGFLLVYSITSQSSFEEIKVFHQQILRVKDKDYFPIVVVGNKCDLETERQISQQTGRKLAQDYQCSFIETSAKQRINVDEAFYNLVREIRRYNRDQSPGGPTSAITDNNTVSQGQYNNQSIERKGSSGGCCIIL